MTTRLPRVPTFRLSAKWTYPGRLIFDLPARRAASSRIGPAACFNWRFSLRRERPVDPPQVAPQRPEALDLNVGAADT
jgi:hypothetical protein